MAACASLVSHSCTVVGANLILECLSRPRAASHTPALWCGSRKPHRPAAAWGAPVPRAGFEGNTGGGGQASRPPCHSASACPSVVVTPTSERYSEERMRRCKGRPGLAGTPAALAGENGLAAVSCLVPTKQVFTTEGTTAGWKEHPA